jgi:hypothetical protein
MSALRTLPRTILKAEYTVLRGAADVGRLAVERVLGQLDESAGRLLHDPDLEDRGRALKRHTSAIEETTSLAAEAGVRRDDAAQRVEETADTPPTPAKKRARKRQPAGPHGVSLAEVDVDPLEEQKHRYAERLAELHEVEAEQELPPH